MKTFLKTYSTFFGLMIMGANKVLAQPGDSFLQHGGDGLSDNQLKTGNIQLSDLPGAILAATNNILFYVGTFAVLMIIVGALLHVFSPLVSDKTKGTNTIKFALIGAVVSWSAWFMVNFLIDNL